MSEESLDWKRTIHILLKEGCSKDTSRTEDGCLENVAKLNDLLDPRTRPYKYGTKIVLTLHQDWAGPSWHLVNVEYGNYEVDRINKEIEDAKKGINPTKMSIEEFIASRKQMLRDYYDQ